MKKITGLLMALALLVGVVAFAAPPKSKKVTEVWTCPMTGKKVTDKKSKTAMAGNYKVHFCCPNCPGPFAKLSKKEQLAKAAEAAKKDKASAGAGKKSTSAEETHATKTAKLTDVWTCPISGGSVKDHEAAKASAVTVGTYRVHFCCEGCPGQFEKLSAEDKLAKAKAAAEKEAGS